MFSPLRITNPKYLRTVLSVVVETARLFLSSFFSLTDFLLLRIRNSSVSPITQLRCLSKAWNIPTSVRLSDKVTWILLDTRLRSLEDLADADMIAGVGLERGCCCCCLET